MGISLTPAGSPGLFTSCTLSLPSPSSEVCGPSASNFRTFETVLTVDTKEDADLAPSTHHTQAAVQARA